MSLRMHLLVPMSGQGSRYREAGYLPPKPMIPVSGTPMIQRLLTCFPAHWHCHFVLAENHRESGLVQLLRELRPDSRISFIPPHVEGPGFAIAAGLEGIPEGEPVFVSYCDYGMVWDAAQFERFVESSACDACLVSYRGFHAHYLSPVTYAYSRLEGERVVAVREKGSFTADREQEYASAGGYYFSSARLLRNCLAFQRSRGLRLNGELYTSLTVQALLEQDPAAHVRVFEIPGFFQWGTPADLRNFEYWERTFAARNRHSRRGTVEQVLIPMAGKGSRFHELTDVPKPLVPIEGKPMFRVAMDSLPAPAAKAAVVALEEVRPALAAFTDGNLTAVYLQETPSGQALSVQAGLDALDPDLEVIVSASDHGTVMSPEAWSRFKDGADADAAIFTVTGFPGTDRRPCNYAYVRPRAADTSEFPLVDTVSVKKALSETPSRDPLLVGTFWFRSVKLLAEGIAELKRRDLRTNGELYLDSVFECLIQMGHRVRMVPLEGYINYGDPDSLAEALYWQEIFGGRRLEGRSRYPGWPIK